MKVLKEEFNEILEKQRIRPVFQPIVSLSDGSIIGYEALSRIIEPKEIQNTEELFHLAGVYGKTWELEQLSRTKILEKYQLLCKKKENIRLFLNVNPMVIHDQQFHMGFTSQHLSQYHLDTDCITFEVTERSAVEDMSGFRDTISHYKEQGYQIAIDDVGSCYSGLNLICDIIPHYLKLDMALIHDIHKDMVKYAMVKALVDFAYLTNIQLIAEGIECEEELKTLLRLGVHNGQGYFLRKPNEEFKEIEKSALDIIQKYGSKKKVRKIMCNEDSSEFRVVLFKLADYKAYRAYCGIYGDEKGDAVIGMMKDVVEDSLSEKETMAMLDRDTIVAVVEKGSFKIKCEMITNKFRNRIAYYYEKEDLERGYIERTNKHGEIKKYPLLELCSERVV